MKYLTKYYPLNLLLHREFVMSECLKTVENIFDDTMQINLKHLPFGKCFFYF